MSSLLPRAKKNVPVNCAGCEYEFNQDPCFEVECPYCGASVGTYCIRPSGHSGPLVSFHAERDVRALKMGFYNHTGNDACGPNSNSDKAKRIISRFSSRMKVTD